MLAGQYRAGCLTQQVRIYARRSGAFGTDEEDAGGNILIAGGAEYIFPLPFVKDQSQLRSSVFVDAGNVYADTCYLSTTQGCGSVDLAQMAVSLGVGVTWYSPMGPLSFSLAAPLKKQDGAETQIFQFSLGQTF